MKKFFDIPTQVKFRADDETMKEEGRKHWFGIAYHDEVICGCCGGTFQIDELESIEDYSNWMSLEETIGGSDYDEEPDINDDVDETGYNPYMGCCDDDC